MSEQTPDLGRIVSLIMENPKLIEEIANMAKGDKGDGESAEVPSGVEESAKASAEPEALPSLRERSPQGKNRSKLLGALKPYVSTERAHAIDSMLSIVEILDAMTGRK